MTLSAGDKRHFIAAVRLRANYGRSYAEYEQIIAGMSSQREHVGAMKNQSLPYDVFFETLREIELDALKAYPVLIVCGDSGCSGAVAAVVRKRGLDAICCPNLTEARLLLSGRRFSLVLSSDVLPDGEIQSIIRLAGTTPVIVFSRRAEWDDYLDALNLGAFDCIACPPNSAAAERIIDLALHELAS